MSASPHTGKLKAIVRGVDCTFDGDVWTTPDADLSANLNYTTRTTPKTHTDIRELAEIVLRKLNIWGQSTIAEFTRDEWETPNLPPGAID